MVTNELYDSEENPRYVALMLSGKLDMEWNSGMELEKCPASQGRKGRPDPGFGLLFWVGKTGLLSCLVLEWESSVLYCQRACEGGRECVRGDSALDNKACRRKGHHRLGQNWYLLV
jgi:hypothetical protein